MKVDTTELRDIDCKYDVLNHIDVMAYEDRIDSETAERLKHIVRYYNGNTLFVLYLRWIEGYKKQRDIARRLDISPQRVSKILTEDLSALRAVLMFSAHRGADLDPLVVDIEERDGIAVVFESDDDDSEIHIGDVVVLKRWAKDPDDNMPMYHGETNPRYGHGKSGDTLIREALEQLWKEKKEREKKS